MKQTIWVKTFSWPFPVISGLTVLNSIFKYIKLQYVISLFDSTPCIGLQQPPQQPQESKWDTIIIVLYCVSALLLLADPASVLTFTCLQSRDSNE